MPAPVDTYESNLAGLARYLGRRFGMTADEVRPMLDAAFYDFIYPMVMVHGKRFIVPRLGTFRRGMHAERVNTLSGQISPACAIMKFKPARANRGIRGGPR